MGLMTDLEGDIRGTVAAKVLDRRLRAKGRGSRGAARWRIRHYDGSLTARGAAIALAIMFAASFILVYNIVYAQAQASGSEVIASILEPYGILGSWPVWCGGALLFAMAFAMMGRESFRHAKEMWATKRELRAERRKDRTLDERVFSFYEDIYKDLERVFVLEMGSACRRGRYDTMNVQIDAMYDALSYHRRMITLPSTSEIIRAVQERTDDGANARLERVVEKLQAARTDIKGLCQLWSCSTGLNGCRVALSSPTVMSDAGDDLCELGQKLGIDEKVAVYYEKGIPAEALSF